METLFKIHGNTLYPLGKLYKQGEMKNNVVL